MGLAVWAEAPDVPGNVCSDARLRGGRLTALAYPKGAPFGQAGWDMGIRFKNLSDLANKLNYSPASTPKHVCGNWVWSCPPIKKGQVTRLAIHVHGLPGKVFFSGQNRESLALTADNIRGFHKDLSAIGRCTAQSATILIVGCLAGQGADGTRLIKRLSGVWPGRQVVAFTTIGYVAGANQLRPGEACTEPGMRDTKETSRFLSWQQQQKHIGRAWNDLTRLPWASEKSPNAKVVRNGVVLKQPLTDIVVKPKKKLPAWLDKELWEARKNQPKAMRLLREREQKGLYYYFPK